MLKVSTVAKELGCGYLTIYRWIKAGKIKAVKIGRFWKIEEKELERIKKEGLRNEEK